MSSKQTAKKAKDATRHQTRRRGVQVTAAKKPQNAQPMERLLTPTEVAEILGVSEKWLAKDRATKRSIRFVRVSANIVRYESSAVQAYIERQRRGV